MDEVLKLVCKSVVSGCGMYAEYAVTKADGKLTEAEAEEVIHHHKCYKILVDTLTLFQSSKELYECTGRAPDVNELDRRLAEALAIAAKVKKVENG